MTVVARALFALFVVLAMLSTARAGYLSGTINGSYQKSTREATVSPGTDSIITPESWNENKQSNLMISYQDVLFQKNLARAGLNLSARFDEISHDWIYRPIYNFDLRSDGYAYSGSYSPRTQTSRIRFPGATHVETRTRFRDWRNSLTLTYPKLPVSSISYNITRAYDDLDDRRTDRKNRQLVIQSSYTTGPVSSNVIYSSARNENRVSSPFVIDNARTMQATTGLSGSVKHVGGYTFSYSYLNTHANREAAKPTPTSNSNIHSIAGMVTSQSFHNLNGTASYSGRFHANRSADVKTNSRDENFSGQLAYAPFTFLSFALTKNYQIASQAGRNRISENLALSASVSRFLRRGVDTRLNWSRTYLQKSEIADETAEANGSTRRISSSDNFTDAFYGSLSATPYRRSKFLADLSVSRANKPGSPEQRYLSSRSLSLSFSMTRSVEGRLSAAFTSRGESLDLFSSFSRIVTAGATYNSGANLNCNLAYSRNDLNSTPRQTNSMVSGYVGYSFRTAYTLYLNANQQEQDNPVPGSPNSRMIRKPRSVSVQLQIRLSRTSSLTSSYTRGTDAAAPAGAGGTNTVQVVYHGQF